MVDAVQDMVAPDGLKDLLNPRNSDNLSGFQRAHIIGSAFIGAIAGCASISDAKPPTFFFALRKVGLLDAPLPRAMAINRFDRLGCYRAKPRAISGDRPPLGS